MYYPYFRGKQNELLAIRETALLLKKSEFTPVIEPVKQSLGALKKALDAVKSVDGSAIVIANPFHGDHAENGDDIIEFLDKMRGPGGDIQAGILLREEITLEEAIALCNCHSNHSVVLVHAGFRHGKELVRELNNLCTIKKNIFFDGRSSKLYQRHFSSSIRILLRDGFKPRRNRDHPEVEFFSDLHITYRDEGMDGFGDFLIVGDEFREGGGPAYAVAIHITYIDESEDDVMNVYHFLSIRQDTPTDPAGKFGEALAKLIKVLDSSNCNIFESDAIKEFRQLHDQGHYPGLGYAKKLSMKHHIETLANYISRKA